MKPRRLTSLTKTCRPATFTELPNRQRTALKTWAAAANLAVMTPVVDQPGWPDYMKTDFGCQDGPWLHSPGHCWLAAHSQWILATIGCRYPGCGATQLYESCDHRLADEGPHSLKPLQVAHVRTKALASQRDYVSLRLILSPSVIQLRFVRFFHLQSMYQKAFTKACPTKWQ